MYFNRYCQKCGTQGSKLSPLLAQPRPHGGWHWVLAQEWWADPQLQLGYGLSVKKMSTQRLKEWKILQPEVSPNPLVVCFGTFLGLGNIQHLNNRSWNKGLQHHVWNFLGHHSHSQIERVRWPQRREVLQILEMAIRPAGVLPAEGATHTHLFPFLHPGAYQKESHVLKLHASLSSSMSSNPWGRWPGNWNQKYAPTHFSR